jgi:hypothetical protein
VGGQAVNLWALYYREQTADLAPFVSRDADVLGDRDTLEAIGKLTGAKPQFFPLRPPSNEIGVVIAKDAKGVPMLIEVLRYVHGATSEDLREPAYTMALGERHVQVQIPGPIALLQAKIANVADLKQAGRQDARHVLILMRLLPSYLGDLKKSATEGRMEERKFLKFLEQLLDIVTTRSGRAVLAGLAIEPRVLFADLNSEGLTKIKEFLEKRLPRKLAQ